MRGFSVGGMQDLAIGSNVDGERSGVPFMPATSATASASDPTNPAMLGKKKNLPWDLRMSALPPPASTGRIQDCSGIRDLASRLGRSAEQMVHACVANSPTR